ncbi:MAG TPA: glycosyltransferase family 4 protein [Thermoanaerobaculia bacterium]|nr:glycosyltransferase family 4 protein [Thermoanaerobaculia bacterium]
MLASRGWWANEDGAGWFLREVWPAVSARRRDARLHFFGARPSGELPAGVASHPSPGDSGDAFFPGSLFVAALRAASGVRMKILESWARGVPVVSTPEAAAGLESTEGVRIAANAEEFAAAVDELARDPASVRRLVESGRRDLARFHDPAAVAERLSGIAAAAAGSRHVPASTADRRSPA